MTLPQMMDVLARCNFRNYTFDLSQKDGVLFLQAYFYAPCHSTGQREKQKTRKWLLSEHMTESELVQTAFKCVLTSEEHEIREQFTYLGQPIFGPHFDVKALVAISRNGAFDLRAPGAAMKQEVGE